MNDLRGTVESRRRQRTGAVIVASLLLFSGVACTDDDSADSAKEQASTSTSTTAADETKEVVVVAMDYKFENLPATVKIGTKLVLENQSQGEMHELVAVKMPDSETRPLSELLTLSEAELDTLFGAAEPAMVLIRPPGGGEMIAAVGDGTFSEPGRYAVICGIPVGVDPSAFMAAMEKESDGPPQVEGGDGPPHFTQGMYGEVTVEA